MQVFNKLLFKFNFYSNKISKAYYKFFPINGLTYNLHLDSSTFGKNIKKIKGNTIEKMFFPKVYNHISEGSILFKYPPIFLKEINTAIVFAKNDFIISNNNVFWPKVFYEHFTKIVPHDNLLIKYIHDNKIKIIPPKKIINLDLCFSLCGVHSTNWAHFLVQYLPKIFQIIEYNSNKIINIVIPNYKDPNILEIINFYFQDANKYRIHTLDENIAIKCNKLLYIENTSIITDHSFYCSPSDIIIPKFVFDILKNQFLTSELFSKKIEGTKNRDRKLFIKRIGSRNVENIIEIEQFFLENGFEIILPHQYTLIEKKEIFSQAKFIACPASSGLTNLIFCQPGTKVLTFMNFQRVTDLYFSTLAENFNIEYVSITDFDNEPENVHSSYKINIEKIKKVYFTYNN
uniref:glycosyltransferase family 61 protein n=1 Tax=Algoriphagus sp. TaxID=1872435 RepID=UPI0040484AC0